MSPHGTITQMCIVVEDARAASANWSKVLGLPYEAPQTIFPAGVLQHYTGGQPAEYPDLQVAKYTLEGIVLELLQPGPGPSPWRAFLDKHGQGVFHLCIFVDDRKVFQQTLDGIGAGLPYHIGYHPGGSYSYVDASQQLGLELSVNNNSDNQALIDQLLRGQVRPLQELE